MMELAPAVLSTPVPAAGDRLGLSEAVAAGRLAAEGANQLPAQARHGLLATAWEVVQEPMLLLLVAAGALYLVMGAASDAAMLLAFVFAVMGITIIQGRRTERALDALRDLSSPHALVVRGGQRRRIPAAGLVRGDLMVVAEGDRIAADALLREGGALSVDESLLTGESVPVAKRPSATAAALDRPGGDHLPTLFAGTLVTSGQGLAEVVATGARSELGRIGSALGRVKPERTRLQQETGRMVRHLALIGAALCCLVVVGYSLTRGGDPASWKQGLLAGIAMAMAVLPEELPVVLTIFLALGAWRISHNRVLTRRMPAIETLGAATVLCTDKTGTLTQNRMTVTRVVADGVVVDLGDPTTEHAPAVQALLALAVLASDPAPFDPMERAIHVAAQLGATGTSPGGGPLALERTYALAPDLLAVSRAWRQGPGQPLLIASKGAPEAIADLCGLKPMRREELARQATALAGEGLRVLGVARGRLPADRLPASHHDLDLEFVGLVGLSDPIRTDVPAAVAECRAAGIRVVMITGDYPATAQDIARRAGITAGGEFITGPQLERMSDQELAQRIRTVQIFARMVPEQKLRLVQALKANHEVVAMTGDGVNDAPALKAAHIGIAMGGRGTDVARESAALVLLDDDFAAIVAAIRLGRRIFDNIRKAVGFTFAVHVPIAGLSILPVFIPDWPLLLLPVHIVFLELVIDPTCTLVFEAEQAEPGIMARPPRDPRERLYAWRGIAFSLLQGVSALAVCVGIFLWAKAGHGPDAARALTFTTLVAATVAIIVTGRSRSGSLAAILRTPNATQWWVVLAAGGLLALVLAWPAARGFFHFAPLHAPDLAVAVAAGLLCAGWFELLKLVRRRRLGVNTP
jgi:Ca2+-transporting ATPase